MHTNSVILHRQCLIPALQENATAGSAWPKPQGKCKQWVRISGTCCVSNDSPGMMRGRGAAQQRGGLLKSRLPPSDPQASWRETTTPAMHFLSEMTLVWHAIVQHNMSHIGRTGSSTDAHLLDHTCYDVQLRLQHGYRGTRVCAKAQCRALIACKEAGVAHGKHCTHPFLPMQLIVNKAKVGTKWRAQLQRRIC